MAILCLRVEERTTFLALRVVFLGLLVLALIRVYNFVRCTALRCRFVTSLPGRVPQINLRVLHDRMVRLPLQLELLVRKFLLLLE